MKLNDTTSHSTSRMAYAFVGILALATAACSSVGKKNLPSPEEVMAQQRGPVQRGEYRIMVGDKLHVKFPYHHARDQELPVRPDGQISLDVTGEILAEGMTPLELAEVIKERSQKYLKKPEVVVIVTGIGDRRVSPGNVVAGGSIHIYGTLRGRAMAGVNGNSSARIYCQKIEAELLAIDGYYQTAEEIDVALRNRPAQAWLEGDTMKITPLN